MKFARLVPAILLAGALAQPALAQKAGAGPVSPAVVDVQSDPKAQSSYVIGLNVGAQLQSGGMQLNTDALFLGIKDALAQTKPRLTDEQIGAATERLRAEVEQVAKERYTKMAEANKSEGDKFLKTNGAKAGVVTLPSGLQYEVLTKGSGATPKPTDVIACNYRGTLLDGTEFDRSQVGQPAVMKIDGLIKGWSEALPKMPVGSKWRLYVPSDLAYGDRGAGGQIGPNAVLIFDIELLSIEKDL